MTSESSEKLKTTKPTSPSSTLFYLPPRAAQGNGKWGLRSVPTLLLHCPYTVTLCPWSTRGPSHGVGASPADLPLPKPWHVHPVQWLWQWRSQTSEDLSVIQVLPCSLVVLGTWSQFYFGGFLLGLLCGALDFVGWVVAEDKKMMVGGNVFLIELLIVLDLGRNVMTLLIWEVRSKLKDSLFSNNHFVFKIKCKRSIAK